MTSKIPVNNVRSIMERIPHRYPFLLVDRVDEYVLGSHIVALKNVTINEPFFQGHFPGLPVMPGVLQLEALAQTGALYVTQDPDLDLENSVFLFSGMNKVKFRRPVYPGDQLVLRMSDFKCKMNIWKMHGVATVDGQIACEADLSAALVGKENME